MLHGAPPKSGAPSVRLHRRVGLEEQWLDPRMGLCPRVVRRQVGRQIGGTPRPVLDAASMKKYQHAPRHRRSRAAYDWREDVAT